VIGSERELERGIEGSRDSESEKNGRGRALGREDTKVMVAMVWLALLCERDRLSYPPRLQRRHHPTVIYLPLSLPRSVPVSRCLLPCLIPGLLS
jgi:hypothetical protein